MFPGIFNQLLRGMLCVQLKVYYLLEWADCFVFTMYQFMYLFFKQSHNNVYIRVFCRLSFTTQTQDTTIDVVPLPLSEGLIIETRIDIGEIIRF